jgi:ribosome biogenesis GTPase / thiamine phosphate phosphatase
MPMNFRSRFESLERLGFNSFFQRQLLSRATDDELSSDVLIARVLAEARGQYLVSTGQHSINAVLTGRLQYEQVRVCVGDFVLLDGDEPHALSRIVQVLERSSLFQRKAWGGTSEAQLIAGNVDLAIVVCALAPDDADPHALEHGLNPRRIERYLRAIRDAPARSLVAINKADLSTRAHEHAERLRGVLRGVPVVLVSAERHDGLTELEHELLPGFTAVLVGSSGVGKSSLTNRLLGRDAQTVHSVRDSDTRGRHTTTGRALFALPSGALLIDTPGMREFGLFADENSDLSATGFEEIDELAPSCHFRDCRHEHEPGCAVLAAIEAGSVAPERLAQAHKLERELAWQRDRHDPRKMSERIASYRARTRAVRAHQKSQKQPRNR